MTDPSIPRRRALEPEYEAEAEPVSQHDVLRAVRREHQKSET